MIVHWYEESFECEKAVRKDAEVLLYDAENNLQNRIFNIRFNEWDHIWLEDGDWSAESDIPTEDEKLRAEIDFLTMMNESLEEENTEIKSQLEIDRADLDYCLMLLEE